MSKKIVYWSPFFYPQELHHWNILFIEPKRLLNKVVEDHQNTTDNRLKALLRCPAFSNYSKNTFYIENPIETEFDIIDGELNYTSENYYHSKVSAGQKTMSYGLSYLFFCEDNLEMLMTAPHFSETNYTDYVKLIPAVFNISKWFRPVNLEMMLIGDKKHFKMKENEPMAYFSFLTDDKVELRRFELNDTLRKISDTCATVSDWWKNVPLINRYDRFLKTKTNKLVMKEINKQLVE